MRDSIHRRLRVATLVSCLTGFLLALAPTAFSQSLALPGPSLPGAGQPSQPTASAPGQRILFKPFVIIDNSKFVGMEISRGIMPADWNLQGGLVWSPALVIPDQFRLHFGDSQDVCAFDMYPMGIYYWSAHNPLATGQIYIGRVIEPPPQNQFQALEQIVIPQYRPDLIQARAQVVNRQNLQEIAQEITAQDAPTAPQAQVTVEAGRETFEYQRNGQTIDEVMNIVIEAAFNPRLQAMNWKICDVSSFRGPKGALDQLDQVRAAMAQNIQPNQQWYDAVNQFVAQELHQTINNLNQQQQQREAAMQQQQAANQAEWSRFDQHMKDLDTQSNTEADIQRQVSPWTDPSGNTYKLPTQYGQAWRGADGRIIMNNEPGYNPNSDPSLTPTQWSPLTQSGN